MRLIPIMCGALLAVMAPQMAEAEALKLCHEPWRPFTYFEGGKPAGAATDILKEAAAKAGMTAEFAEVPYARCIAGIVDHSFDGMAATSDESSLTAYGPALAYWMIGAYVHKDWPGETYASLADFKGKTVGLTAGYESYGEKLDPHIEGKTGWKIERSAELLNLRKLAAKRLDVVIADNAATPEIIQKEALAIRMLRPMIDARPQFLMLGAHAAAKGARLAPALEAVKSGGAFDTIYRRYLQQDYVSAEKEALAAAVKQ